jgi:transposase
MDDRYCPSFVDSRMSQAAVSTSLPNDLSTCHQMIAHLLADMQDKDREILNLKCQLEALRRRIFGRKSEKIDPNQLALFEDLTQQLAQAEAERASSQEAAKQRPKTDGNGKKKGHGRKPLPPDLPRERIEVPPDEQDLTCPCCKKAKTQIGEKITEVLDYVPASFVVRQYVRPEYMCKGCEGEFTIADLPPQPIPKGIPGPGLLAQILTGKYADHAPLNRQLGIFRRHGVDIAVSTMCDWVRDMADLLSPIVIEMKRQILQSHWVNTDDTPVLVQNLSGKTCGKGYLWVYIGDGVQVIFEFTATHSRAGPLGILGHYAGYVQADAHKSYDALFEASSDGTPSPRIEVGCWAHTRRKFYDARLDDRRRCTEMLALIRRLYDVEREAKETELDPDARLALRQEQSVPILNEIRPRLEQWSIELLPKNPVAQAVHYARAQWTALTRFLEDGRLPLDNNIAERMLRLAAVGRKNYMFFGSDAGGHRAAVIYSLVASCKLVGIDPFAYLRDAITTTCDPTFDRFAGLTPAAWKAARQAQTLD